MQLGPEESIRVFRVSGAFQGLGFRAGFRVQCILELYVV